MFVGKSFRYSVPLQNAHIHELLIILRMFGFIMNYCKMYVKSLTYQIGLLFSSSADIAQ
jgi:hypothetical protein